MAKRRKRGPLAELGRGLRQMTPNRVTARFASGGKYQTWTALVRGATRSTVPGPRAIPMRAVPRGSPLPTTKASAAKSRAAAAKKQAAKQPVIKKTAGGKQVAKRVGKGRFDGSVSVSTFGPREQAMYERGMAGYVDPGQHVRQPRRKK